MAVALSQSRAVQINALPRIDLGLTIERQMVAELGGEDMSEQTWASQASINGTAGCRCLHDAVASGTAHPGAYMTNYLEACWKVLEHLGGIFAELLQSAAAVGTALFTGEMGVDFTRQWSGSERRFLEAGERSNTAGSAASSGASSARLASSSSSLSSSCSICRSTFSELRPNCMRRSLAISSSRCSIWLLWEISSACCKQIIAFKAAGSRASG